MHFYAKDYFAGFAMRHPVLSICNFYIPQHAWSVAIMIEDEKTGEDKLHCSASLISDRQIITAAHCFFKTTGVRYNDSKFTLIFGVSDPTDQASIKKRNGKSRIVNEVHINPLYNEKSAYYDVAIVEFSESIKKFQENIWPICLPNSPMTNINHLDDRSGSVVAYGPNMNNVPILSEIQLTVRSKNWCDVLYKVSPVHIQFTEIGKKLPDLFNNTSIFCAQNEGTNFGTCKGDSGMYIYKYSSILHYCSFVCNIT